MHPLRAAERAIRIIFGESTAIEVRCEKIWKNIPRWESKLSFVKDRKLLSLSETKKKRKKLHGENFIAKIIKNIYNYIITEEYVNICSKNYYVEL